MQFHSFPILQRRPGRLTTRGDGSVPSGRIGLAASLVPPIAILALCCPLLPTARSSDWLPGEAFAYRRKVDASSTRPFPEVVVAEFYTHGAYSPDSQDMAVYDSNGPVPMRLLQVGPGDYCRIAIQTTPHEAVYNVYYGGKGLGRSSPPWKTRTGLVLETRRWRSCDLNRLDAVRAAFADARPIGSDYVSQVFHSFNPLDPAPAPFFSRYDGMLRVPAAGKYAFFTSSQDCSFLLIDGREVVAAPGRHGPARRARVKGVVELNAGAHRFEYWHAAAGDTSVAVAAWQPPGADRPALIPAAAFGNDRVLHLPAIHPEHRDRGPIVDFMPRVLGEVLLDEKAAPMIRVRFDDIVTRSLLKGAKVEWDFGDGQRFLGEGPEHIYLSPGEYQVSLTVFRRVPMKVVNRVSIGRPAVVLRNKRKADSLDRYIPLLTTYDASALSGPHLVQLAAALERAGKLQEAVAAARTALRESSTRRFDDRVRYELAMRAGRLLRYELDDARAALALWQQAADAIADGPMKARCAIAAADTAINDALTPKVAANLLETAQRQVAREALQGDWLARYHRVRGDWHARHGRGREARREYELAMQAKPNEGTANERSAWRGAYSRFVEAFLREGKLREAREKLDAWLADFPIERIDGYHSLLQAQYWAAAGKLDRAIATATDSLQANPDSAYADQLLIHVARWQAKRGDVDRAIAAYRSLAADYPGSPLVAQARQEAQRLESTRPSTKKDQ